MEIKKINISLFFKKLKAVSSVNYYTHEIPYNLLKNYLVEHDIISCLDAIYVDAFNVDLCSASLDQFHSEDRAVIKSESDLYRWSINFLRGVSLADDPGQFAMNSAIGMRSDNDLGFNELYNEVIIPIEDFLERYGQKYTSIDSETEHDQARKIIKQVNDALARIGAILCNPQYHKSRDFTTKATQIFVITPFDSNYISVIRPAIKKVLECEELIEYQFDLVDADIASDKIIIEDIWRLIAESRMIICNISSLNVNVYYELGIAHTLGKRWLF